MKVYHTSPVEIKTIDKYYGLFDDCLFFSWNPYSMSVGEVVLYSLDISDMDFLDVSQIFYKYDQNENETVMSCIRRFMNYFNVDQETAEGLIEGSINEIDANLDDEAMFFIQKEQGHIARDLGYFGAESEDEQGSVLIVPMFGKEHLLTRELNE